MEIDYDKPLRENIIANLIKEKEELVQELSIANARINSLETLVIELYNKIDRLINEADNGEDI